VFIKESNLEDFSGSSSETVYVSTMHKSKGREFDNVCILLDGFSINDDQSLRLLYVAMTRAKKNLSIYLNGSYLDLFEAVKLKKSEDHLAYQPPAVLPVQLTHRDVWPDSFIRSQEQISMLQCGDELLVTDTGICDIKGNALFSF